MMDSQSEADSKATANQTKVPFNIKEEEEELIDINETKSKGVLEEVIGYFKDIRFLLPYLVNQIASLANNFLIATTELQIAVPTVNSMTFIAAFVTQKLLKKESLIDYYFFAGIFLIVAGLVICMESSGNNIHL